MASLCVNSGKKLYTGIAHLGDLKQEESSKRLIQSYRCMGYDDQTIMKEFLSYKQRKEYEDAYESNIASLPEQWPDNFTLIAEVILDYWHTPDDYKGIFEDVLDRKNLEINLMPELLIIQEPQEFMVDPAYAKVVYTETLSLYKRVDSP